MHLTDIPVEVLLDNFLPFAQVRDVLSLGTTNKYFAAICADEAFWRRRCREDFNFTGQETARQCGWKNLYKGLNHPKVFVWGESRNRRLGRDIPEGGTYLRGAPYPIEVKIPGSRIVSLVAGGMSFHALDSKGALYVWGALNGESMDLHSEGFAVKYKVAPVPHQLLMPNPIHTVSCGRMHTMVLDSKNHVWTFANWGRPFRLDTPMLDCSSPETTPVQAESGWSFCSILTQSGDVLVFWPFSGEVDRRRDEQEAAMDQRGDCQAYAPGNRVRCITWALQADPSRIPHIPQLPELNDTGISQEENSKPTTLIKIAAFDNHLIGLTNKGHVLKFGLSSNESNFDRSTRWQYLEKFSELSKVVAHPAFQNGVEIPSSLQITHITAHFNTFVAYSTGSSSIILMGDIQTNSDSQPTIIPELQNRSVISVILGDYHYGALTSDGQLLTWGRYSSGALGFGLPTKLPVGSPGGHATEEKRRSSEWNRPEPPPDVPSPSPVHFNHGPKPGGRRFCFAATAAGWHTGALVICLDPQKEVNDAADEDDDGKEPHRGLPRPSNDGPSGSRDQPSLPSDAGAFGLGRIFRIGFAGRGRGRGTP